MPGSPFAYWVSEGIRSVFSNVPAFETGGRFARTGLTTTDDFRFVRCFWEVSPETRKAGKWPPIVRGGRRSPFFAEIPSVLNWYAEGLELKALTVGRYGSAAKRIFNEEHYFKPGLTWPLRGVCFSASAVPAGCVFSGGGKMAFAPTSQLLGLLAALNSSTFDAFIRLFAGKVGGVQYEAGLIAKVPLGSLDGLMGEQATTLATRAWSLRRSLYTHSETSHAFVLPALLQITQGDFSGRVQAWSHTLRVIDEELAAVASTINILFFDFYGFHENDRSTITEGFQGNYNGQELSDQSSEFGDNGVGDEDTEVEAYPVVSGLSRCSSSVRTADLRGLSRWMMSQ